MLSDGRPELLRLAGAIAELYRESATPMLARAARRLARLPAKDAAAGAGARKPVCRFVADALAAGRAGPLRAIAEAFAAVEPRSDWVQNPNHGDATFLDRYGYVELVGAGRPFECRENLVGFLLLGPGTHYPDHHHAAEEVYHVVAGRAHWWREDLGWRAEPPGAAIHHAPHRRHAMRTGTEPLLALYCWSGEVGSPARLSGQDRAAK